MLLEELTNAGKRRKSERTLSLECLICCTNLACPATEDFWFWVKSPEAVAFITEHQAHGARHAVGGRIRETEAA